MKLLLFFSFLLVCFSQVILAQDAVETPKLNAMSNVFGITGEAGVTLGVTDYDDGTIDYHGKASFEYYLPSMGAGNIGLRVFGQSGFMSGTGISNLINPTNGYSTKIDIYGGGIFYILSIDDAVYPWIGAGISNFWFYPKDGNGNALPNYTNEVYNKYMMAYNGDAGVRVMLSKSMSMNVAGGIVIASDDYLDDVHIGSSNDLLMTASLGFSYYFGRNADSDGDGVPNTDDACPGTPLGVQIDEFGCPLDEDHDGVPDSFDKCLKTPKGVKVDNNGCAIDSDMDGVADAFDKCSNTPGGVRVDKDGCPLDSDNDGVPDYNDKCSSTPAGTKVDANGCAVDTDRDGVPDSFDKCPNTPTGVQVNSDGCPIEKEEIIKEIEPVVLSGDTNFEFNKSKLLPSAFAALDGVVGTMKEHPDYIWEIGGHTDAIGSTAANNKLSRERAQSVVDYLLRKGVSNSNLKIVGYGEDVPLATNETVEGRSMNRRVEIKLITKNKK